MPHSLMRDLLCGKDTAAQAIQKVIVDHVLSCPANAAGVKILGRKPSIVTDDQFSYPLSARFDELDCAVVFDHTFIPWENVFAYRDPEFCNAYMFRSFPLGEFYHLVRKLG